MPKVLNWIDENPTLVNILFTILCGLVGWVFYRFTYYRKKKSAAMFGFFVRLDMILTVLQSQINTYTNKQGPFVLLYTEDARKAAQLQLPGGSVEKAFEQFGPIAIELKSLLLETENNVYPKACKKEEWYNNQIILLHFALMIIDRLGVETIKSPLAQDFHSRLEELKKAVKTLRGILNQVKY